MDSAEAFAFMGGISSKFTAEYGSSMTSITEEKKTEPYNQTRLA